MIKFLPKGSPPFGGLSIMKAMILLMLMKTMWKIHLIQKTCDKEKMHQEGIMISTEGKVIFQILAKGHVIAFNLKEAIMDNILTHDHVNLTIFYCLGDISVVRTIWKQLLVQTIMEGFSLKELLVSHNESYIPEVDVEGMIGANKKKKLP